MSRGKTKTIDVGLPVVALAFAAGMLVDSCLRVYGPPTPAGFARGFPETTIPPEPSPAMQSASRGGPRMAPAPSTIAPGTKAPPTNAAPVATAGHTAKLRLPIEGIEVESLKGGFAETRAGHVHEAVDILAPRNTAVHAVEDGTVAKLFVSKAGGNTIYEFDETGRFAYYYAHLERYAIGLREGDSIKEGQVIGYVGTSGNAPKNTPHLHFAVFELGPEREWWKGKAIDPFPLFR
jgi:murein DD-endopeptidase MepM/ murein hydrolase activator NlpD